MGERVFVTGATGRIGRELVVALKAAGHDVVGLTRSDAGEAMLKERGIAVIRGSLDDAEALRRGAEGAEVVYHLAGGVRGAGTTTPDVLNREGTERILEICRGVGSLRAFVLASSCAVYGDRSNMWIEEDFKPHPNTRYGASKAEAEALVLSATERGEIPGKIARIAAVYGPEFPFTMADRMRDGKAWLPGEGRNHIPTLHVDDCVAALQVVAGKGGVGEIYNLADREQPTTREFYEEVHKLVGGKPVRFWSTYVPSYVQTWAAKSNERVQSRVGQKPRFTPDNLKLFTNSVRMRTERLQKELGFEWTYPDHVSGLKATFGA